MKSIGQLRCSQVTKMVNKNKRVLFKFDHLRHLSSPEFYMLLNILNKIKRIHSITKNGIL